MTGSPWWPWLALLLLGAGHGLNPGMGWLFAVALGMQEGKAAAVWRALPPLALGHALAVALALALAALVGTVLPAGAVKWLVALMLLGMGLRALVRHRHPRFGGMRVGPRDLAVWSLLMATAHGAGLMVVPVVLAASGKAAPHEHAMMLHAGMVGGGGETGLAAALVHTVGYLGVTGLLAVVVYRKLGLRLLRTAWVNLDLVWAVALIIAALVTPLI